jgi:3-oxoadipate enol-lactonase
MHLSLSFPIHLELIMVCGKRKLQHSQHYQVVTYDTRGHGASAVIDTTTLSNLAEDVVDILDALKIEKAHFCGISMGGITGLYLAIHHAERFLSVTIANSAAKIGTAEAWNSRAASVEQNGLAELVKTTHTRWFSEHFDYAHDVLAQKTIQSLSITPHKAMQMHVELWQMQIYEINFNTFKSQL